MEEDMTHAILDKENTKCHNALALATKQEDIINKLIFFLVKKVSFLQRPSSPLQIQSQDFSSSCFPSKEP